MRPDAPSSRVRAGAACRPAVRLLALSLLGAGVVASSVPAQGPGPSPVRYTEAREMPVRRSIRLPGSVESPTVSIVASEVEGLVIELKAREGDSVRKGQPLAQLRTTSLELRRDAAVAQLKEAESRLKLAELNLQRAKDLLESQVVSQQEYDTAQYERNAWQGRVEELTAEIARIDLALKLATIRAPFGGLVVDEMTEVGQWAPIGGPIVEMISLDELEIRVEVPERYFASLNPGAVATATFEAIPDLKVEGRITTVIPRADPRSRTFPLKVRVKNRDGRLGVGMLAQVIFPAGASYRATVVPKDAVVNQADGQVVYLIDGDEKVQVVNVRTGQGVGAWIEVEGEVRAGQRVITRGNERLQPGAPVTAQALEYALP